VIADETLPAFSSCQAGFFIAALHFIPKAST
jgi:hypothetical protein